MGFCSFEKVENGQGNPFRRISRVFNDRSLYSSSMENLEKQVSGRSFTCDVFCVQPGGFVLAGIWDYDCPGPCYLLERHYFGFGIGNFDNETEIWMIAPPSSGIQEGMNFMVIFDSKI